MKKSHLISLSCFISLLLAGCFAPSESHSSSSSSIDSSTTSTTSSSTSTSTSDSTSTDSGSTNSSSSSSDQSSSSSSSDTSLATSEEHIHTFETGYHFDENYHWHDSTCGHDVKSGYEPHEFYTTVVPNDWGVAGYTRHTCTECGYFYDTDPTAAKVHSYSSEWNHDSTHHWHDCLDEGFEGKENGANLSTHNFVKTTIAPKLDREGYDLYECECGYSYKNNYKSDSTNWTSLYEINACHGNVSGEVDTFGLITGITKNTDSSDNEVWYYIVQCSDANGNEGGVFATECEPTSGTPYFSVGDFVHIHGIPKLECNYIVFTNESAFYNVSINSLDNVIDYSASPIQLTPDMLSEDHTSNEWYSLEKMGQCLVSISFSEYTVYSEYYVVLVTIGTKRFMISCEGDNANAEIAFFNEHVGDDITITGASLLTLCFSRNDPSDEYNSEQINPYIIIDSLDDISVGPSTSVKGIYFDSTSETIDVGETFNLNPTVYPDTALNKSVLYTSSDTSVATVTSAGVVTGISDGRAIITATTVDGGFMASVDFTVGDAIDLDSLECLSITSAGSGTYETNTGSVSNGGYSFGSYRWTSSGGYLGKFYAHTNRLENVDDGSQEGAFYNIQALPEIRAIEIAYKCSGPIKLSYGNSREYGHYEILPAKATYSNVIVELVLDNVSYFMVETQGYNLFLNNLYIYHTGSTVSHSESAVTIANQYRIAPTVYSGSLVSGVSTVTVPTSYEVVSGHYVATATKTYTYYSYDDVAQIKEDNPSTFNPADYAIVDPVDVANYYIAFGKIPANYGGSVNHGTCGTVSEVNSLFGSTYARKVSEYNYTTGYVKSVPANTSSPNFYYYEFDIAAYSGYTTSNRDVGRVVIFHPGFTTYNDNIPVAVLTLDHYCLFQEYLGSGNWGLPFNAKNGSKDIVRLNKSYGTVYTYSKA